MASSSLARAVAVTTAVLAFIAVAACDDHHGRYGRERDCDYSTRQCRTYCDYWCDGWGCYPTCYDRCWDECGSNRNGSSDQGQDDDEYPTKGPSSGSTATPDASVLAPIPTDSGAPVLEPPSGSGVLCTSCSANSDCESGALCILRGGPPRDAGATDSGAPVGRGFCGHACGTSQDCPDGFLCSQIGSTRQCLPTAGNCQ